MQQQQPLLRVPQLLPISRNSTSLSISHAIPVVPKAPSSGLTMINSNGKLTTVVNWGSRVMESIETAVWNMSSTMKKRRAKMNKHKLQKRRKLLRRKSN
jgi:hypothetical protein